MVKNKAKIRRLFIPILVLIGLGGAYYYIQNKNQAVGFATHTPITVARGDIEQIVTAQGTLEPKDAVEVGAQVSGQLERLYVDIGDNVITGDPIAKIDAEVFEARVQGDEARLKTMQAQRLQSEAEIRQSRQKRDRNRQLIEANAISREVYEDSQTTLDIAEARLMALDAQIEEARSTLEGNRTSLNYTNIFAPMDGTVVEVNAKEGETLNANQTTPTIIRIADLNTMTVRAQVTEADINKITPDMSVYFTTLGAQNRRWEGRVRQVLPTPEILNDVVLYHVLIDVENEDRSLMSGMTTQMFFVLGRAENVPVIPAAALIRRAETTDTGEGTAYIVRIIREGAAVEHTVFIGLSDRANAQVISGLAPGDQILLPVPQSETQAGTTRQRMPRL